MYEPTLKEFVESYKSCIQRMDFSSVKPYTETELQPLYSRKWLEYIHKLTTAILAEQDMSKFDGAFANYSVIRSMLVMDLFDCLFQGNTILAFQIFRAYNKLLTHYYKEDPYSLEKNIHSKVNFSSKYVFDDTVEKSFYYKEILHWLQNFSYTKWQDIYADNTYEVVGPFKDRNYTYLVQDFHNMPLAAPFTKARVITRHEKFNIYDIKIDMFGHMDYKLYDNTLVPAYSLIISSEKFPELEIYDEPAFLDDFTNLFKQNYNQVLNDSEEIDIQKKKEANFSSRYFRYEKLFSIFNIEVNKEEIHKLLQKEPRERLDVNSVIKLFNKL
jgi:hypothetical protein